MASDVEEYFALIREPDRREPALSRTAGRPSSAAPNTQLDYLTNFERKYRLEGTADLSGSLHVGNELRSRSC